MLIAQVFVVCLGMFVIHILAASEVNHNVRSPGGCQWAVCLMLLRGWGTWRLTDGICLRVIWLDFVLDGPCCNRRNGYLLHVDVWPDASDTTTINRRIFIVFPALNFKKKGSVVGLFTGPFVNIVKYKLCGAFQADIG